MTFLLTHRQPNEELFSAEWLRFHGVIIVILLLAAFLVTWLAGRGVRRMQRKLEGVDSLTMAEDLQRATTVAHALSYAAKITIWTVAILLVLTQFEVQLGPLIAGAGIAGVALGFGAQALVRDFLSGFFILLENQFGVGDIIDVTAAGGMVSGKVEQLSLRTTSIRAFDGTLHIVPNGNIQMIGNKSRGWARAIVDVGVSFREDLGNLRSVLDELFQELRADEDFGTAFISGPEVLGVENMTDYEVVIRIVAETRPSRRWDVQRELLRRIKQRFDERGIEIPYPTQVMMRPDETTAEDGGSST